MATLALLQLPHVPEALLLHVRNSWRVCSVNGAEPACAAKSTVYKKI